MSNNTRAGVAQGITLVACAWLAVFASAALLGPVLPRMTEHFRSWPHVELMISLVATLPAAGVAILSIPFGFVADRLGHRRVLFWATLVYGFLGVAPFWLNSLSAIVASRAALGIAEAAVMTCSAALIGHYFTGKARDLWYALQTGTAPLLAIVAISLGGNLGERDWHDPFLVYGFGFVLFVLVATLLREPTTRNDGPAMGGSSERFHWGPLLGISAITVFALTAFLIPVIQTSFLLTERGIPSPRLIGFWQSLSALANPVGALLFGVLPWRPIAKVAISFLLMGIGFAIMSLLPTWQAAVEGVIVANLGCGMVLPTLITWALSGLSPQMRGRGAGAWMCASFFGQFLSPLVIVALKSMTGSLSNAILCYAVACGIATLMAALATARRTNQGLS